MSEITSLSQVRDSKVAGNTHAPLSYIEGLVYNHSQRKWGRTLLDLPGGEQSAKLGETRSRALPAPTTQLFVISACCSRTGINCSHHCECFRKEVWQCHYTYWRGAWLSHHPLGHLQDGKLSSSAGPAGLHSGEGDSWHLFSNGYKLVSVSQGAVTTVSSGRSWHCSRLQQHPCTFCFIFLCCLSATDRAVASGSL